MDTKENLSCCPNCQHEFCNGCMNKTLKSYYANSYYCCNCNLVNSKSNWKGKKNDKLGQNKILPRN